MTLATRAVGLLVGCSLSIGSAGAQEAVPPAAVPAATPARADVQRRLRMLRAWEITRALKLAPEAAGKLLAIFADGDDRRQALFRDLRESTKALRKLVRNKAPDAGALTQHLDPYMKARASLSALRADEFQKLREVLTPVQQAKYLLAERRFQKKIRQILKNVRKK